MNVSYSWLRDFVPFELSPEELRDLLTMRTATVDELVALRDDLKDVVIGRVVEASRHPDSDRLWVTRVDAGGDELLDVVCGAPNVQAGKLYPFAPAGSTLPGGLKLERRKIRGAVSNGMLCSPSELGLGADGSGILELDVSAAPGTPLLSALPIGDTRLVLDVTPNRADLLSHLGVAREIAAAVGAPLSLPALEGVDDSPMPPAVGHEREGTTGGVTVRIEDTEGCPRYAGAVIRGVRVGPSPQWLVDRLASVGARSINNVVDATNYVLHELGQPMHAFDLARLRGQSVVVRRARDGERVTTLDGVERTLPAGATVIADADRAQAVAGVMGGAESEVGEGTTDIFLEVASFDARSVRRTRRALGLSTDASQRFERGTDVEGIPRAIDRAVRLLLAVAGGNLDGAPVDLYPVKAARAVARVRASRASRLLGVPIAASEIARLLSGIGFDVKEGDKDSLEAIVPSWRHDIREEVDLIEEVARLRGYDTFPKELRPFRVGKVPMAPLELLAARVRDTLVGRGLLEARPMPFVRGAPEGYVRVANPLAENEAYLRRDLLESLAGRAEHNLAHMRRDVRLFEVGAAFAPGDSRLPREQWRVAVLVTGTRRPAHWTEANVPDVDEWDARAIAESLAATVSGGGWELRPASEERGTTIGGAGELLWEIAVDDRVCGAVRRLELDAPVWAAPAFGIEMVLGELDASSEIRRDLFDDIGDALRVVAPRTYRARALPSTPAAEFDLALLVPEDMPAARVERTLREGSGDLLERLELLSEYRGSQIPEGLRSVAWRLTLRHPERTLRDKEIAGRRERLLRLLEDQLGVRQRT